MPFLQSLVCWHKECRMPLYTEFGVLGQGNAECHYIQSLVCWDGEMQNVIIYNV